MMVAVLGSSRSNERERVIILLSLKIYKLIKSQVVGCARCCLYIIRPSACCLPTCCSSPLQRDNHIFPLYYTHALVPIHLPIVSMQKPHPFKLTDRFYQNKLGMPRAFKNLTDYTSIPVTVASLEIEPSRLYLSFVTNCQSNCRSCTFNPCPR